MSPSVRKSQPCISGSVLDDEARGRDPRAVDDLTAAGDQGKEHRGAIEAAPAGIGLATVDSGVDLRQMEVLRRAPSTTGRVLWNMNHLPGGGRSATAGGQFTRREATPPATLTEIITDSCEPRSSAGKRHTSAGPGRSSPARTRPEAKTARSSTQTGRDADTMRYTAPHNPAIPAPDPTRLRRRADGQPDRHAKLRGAWTSSWGHRVMAHGPSGRCRTATQPVEPSGLPAATCPPRPARASRSELACGCRAAPPAHPVHPLPVIAAARCPPPTRHPGVPPAGGGSLPLACSSSVAPLGDACRWSGGRRPHRPRWPSRRLPVPFRRSPEPSAPLAVRAVRAPGGRWCHRPTRRRGPPPPRAVGRTGRRAPSCGTGQGRPAPPGWSGLSLGLSHPARATDRAPRQGSACTPADPQGCQRDPHHARRPRFAAGMPRFTLPGTPDRS